MRPQNNRLPLLVWTAVVGLCVGLSSLSCGDDEKDRVRVIVATVNGQEITEDMLVEQLRHGPGPGLLVEMIDERLIRAQAQRRQIQPGPEQVELKLSTATSLCGSLQILEARLEQRGISLEEFKDRLRLDAMLDQIALQEIPVSQTDIEQYRKQHQEEFSHGEQVRAWMIMLETRENAETVAAALAAGGDFAGLAEAFSTDPGTAPQSGDMGYFEREDYAPEIAQVAFELEPGQISDIIQAPDGYCILRVEDRRPARVRPLAQVQDEISARLKQERQAHMRQEWLVEQRKRARLTTRDQPLRKAVERMLDSAPPPQPYQF